MYVVGGEEKDSSEHDVMDEYSPSEGAKVERVQRLKSGEEERELEEIAGLAVDASGTLWVYWEEEGEIDGFTKESSRQRRSAAVVAAGLGAPAGDRIEI